MVRHLLALSSAVSLSALASAAAAQTTTAPTTAADSVAPAAQGAEPARAGAAAQAPATPQPTVPDQTQDIVVTAQKRTDRLRDVPLSINAATGDQLKAAGITSTADLVKLVPGFSAISTAFGNPVFFIRGVGFNDTTLGISPAVSIYIDQQPLSFSPMARGAVLDLERVEVLKGPQGTLFGQNSTGGAVNYIAGKPTRELKEGFDLTFGRFNEADGEAFVSGPVSSTLSLRAAVRTEIRGDWQRGYVTDEYLGKKRFLNGRFSALWQPLDRVSVLLTADGWRDRSDAQQPQFVEYTPAKVGATANPVPFPVASFPAAPRDARDAAWPLGFDYRLDNWLYRFAADMEADLTDGLHLSSLTSYDRFHQSIPINYGGTIYPNAFSTDTGSIETFSQELRLSADMGDRLKLMLGGNYKFDRVDERQIAAPLITSSSAIGPFPFLGYFDDNNQRIRSKSVFGSVDYKIVDQLTLQGSIRYNAEDRDFSGCVRDDGDGTLARGVSALIRQTIAPGACTAINAAFQPLPIITDSLDQDNVSYRVSLNWKPNVDTLIYANVTKGYKSGSFPTLPGFFTTQEDPIGQESVMAYEAGTKFRAGRLFDVTGAGFYYDYRDKQLLGAKADPIFGVLPALVSIPKSHVAGGEVSLSAGPFSGVSLLLNGTYVATRVDSDPALPTGPFGNVGTFVGQSFPFTPKWQGSASVEYRFPVSATLNAFAGASATTRTATEAQLLSGVPAAAAQEALIRIPGYVLLDLRAGVETPNHRWQIELFGRNVTDQFYITGIKKTADFVSRYTGMPATYGVSVHYRY